MSLVSSWLENNLGVLSWVPGLVMIFQLMLSFLLFIFTLIAVIFLPGKLLKIAALIVGFISIMAVWYV